MRTLAVICAASLAITSPVQAEEWAASAADTPKPAKRAVKKPVIRKKVEPPAATPSAPVPYLKLKPNTPQTPLQTTLAPITQSEALNTVPVAGVTTTSDIPPPPPPPTIVVNLKTPKPETTREINLKCDTVTVIDKKQTSRGTFYLSLIPSDAFPDSGADFKVMSIDPGHHSIIRETLCFTFRCNATVSPTYYELIDQTQKRGGYLKISLNRTTGAFYAQKQSDQKRFRLGSTDVLNETGTCRPQTTGTATLF